MQNIIRLFAKYKNGVLMHKIELKKDIQSMVDKIEVLEDIKSAEAQISQRTEISHREVKEKFARKS
ncbi:MAG: hypothetical protein A2057_16935 [Ignavibacteria bacterium GWA2_35_9]|nr:MAG: hypothetical protein A2057_16935 [Ignavibacteria bacterium GWA2_35_9]OGU44339.1 MAG: hypothetical protein A2000_04440 [Ignavibacteria bacterium GWB2_36_8]OGU50857.1 MAG: hypothetical protein A2080_03840 [Ignavibacteria bacterium GWC2_36_12]